MSSDLVLKRDYLAAHRRMIVGRAVAGAVIRVMPIPLLDDWLLGMVVGSGYRRIAAAHHVDVQDDAVTSLVFGRTPPPVFGQGVATAVAYRLATGAWKRMLVVVTAARRARAAARTFVTMTLFDHYCARLHVGLGLSREDTLELCDAMDEAISATPGGLSFDPFRRVVTATARATVKAPLELADLVSGGALRRYLDRRAGIVEAEAIAEAAAVSEVDAALDKQLAESSSFLARSVTAVELQLSAEVNPYLDGVIARFDEIWRRRRGGAR